MKTIINAGFWRRQERVRGRRVQRIAVSGMEFDKPFSEIKGSDVFTHAKAPPSAEGWTLQGWADVTKKVAR